MSSTLAFELPTATQIATDVERVFAEDLAELAALPLHLWDERLTTTEAHRHLDDAGHAAMGRKGIIDQVAAVLILQSFLQSQESPRSRSIAVSRRVRQPEEQFCRPAIV